MSGSHVFTADNFHTLCDQVGERDEDLHNIIKLYGYPPMWSRTNTFESLVHIILEQQVSLASAKAALEKLREKLMHITPENVLLLNGEEMKLCYVSRQKSVYLKHLAENMLNKNIDLDAMESLHDDDIRKILLSLKGVGHWTIDVYLIFVLHRADVFPMGDLAAINALKEIKNLPKETLREELLPITLKWAPYRTLAAMLLWHFYLSQRIKK